MIPFRERNPVVIGAISLALIAASLVVAFRAGDLPVIGGGDTYYAAFSESGGLKTNDEVRIAGVRVGKVDSVTLDGDHVKVAFKVDAAEEFGPTTNAAIKVKTLLGAMYLSLEPAGAGQIEGEGDDPDRADRLAVRRRGGLRGPRPSTTEQIDTDQLAASLTTLADLTRNTPEEFRAALDGVTRLSANVAARDGEINTLLVNLEKVSRCARRARRGHRGADERRRRAVPGAGEPPRGDPQPARRPRPRSRASSRCSSSRAARTSSPP